MIISNPSGRPKVVKYAGGYRVIAVGGKLDTSDLTSPPLNLTQLQAAGAVVEEAAKPVAKEKAKSAEEAKPAAGKTPPPPPPPPPPAPPKASEKG